MENFVLYIIVGLVACSNFAYAGWHDACTLEKQTLSACGKKFEGYKEHIPSCWEEILERFYEVDWSCAKQIKSNMISCRNHFKSNNLEGSMEKCMGADWSCHKDCYEKIVKFYKENEGEITCNKIAKTRLLGEGKYSVLKCSAEFIKEFMIMGKKYKSELLTTMENFQFSDGCKGSIMNHWRWRFEEAGFDICN